MLDFKLKIPFVSVVIPIFNTGAYLNACLDSVINQTLSDIEIICVDDNSNDTSKDILNAFKKKDPRIKTIYHEENLGTLMARKHGAELASGKYIMFLDSDDMYVPNACETAFRAIEKNRTEIVRFGVEVLNYQKHDNKKNYLHTNDVEYLHGRNLLWLWHEGKIKGWETTNRIFQAESCKEAFKHVKNGHFVMAEDLLYFFVFSYYAKTYSEIKDVLYIYRWGTGSYSGLKDGIDLSTFEKFLTEKNVFDAIINFIEKQPDYSDYNAIIQKFYYHLLRDNIFVWNNRLQEKYKDEGFAKLIKTWGVESISIAIKLLTRALHNDYMQIEKRCETIRKELLQTKQKIETEEAKYRKLNSEYKSVQLDLLHLKQDYEKVCNELMKIKVRCEDVTNSLAQLKSEYGNNCNEYKKLNKRYEETCEYNKNLIKEKDIYALKLKTISNSSGYKVLQKFYGLRDVVFPDGTIRRRVYNKILLLFK